MVWLMTMIQVSTELLKSPRPELAAWAFRRIVARNTKVDPRRFCLHLPVMFSRQ
jgi:hypothetical protein